MGIVYTLDRMLKGARDLEHAYRESQNDFRTAIQAFHKHFVADARQYRLNRFPDGFFSGDAV